MNDCLTRREKRNGFTFLGIILAGGRELPEGDADEQHPTLSLTASCDEPILFYWRCCRTELTGPSPMATEMHVGRNVSMVGERRSYANSYRLARPSWDRVA